MTQHANQKDEASADEKNLRLLIDHTNNPMWYIDTGYKIVACNPAFRQWVFNFIDEELDKGDDILFDGKNKTYQEKFEMCYRLALSGNEFQSVEDIHINNEIRYTTISFNPVFDENKDIIGVSCFARDITEQRKHLLKIEAQNIVLTEIAAIESHKIRGPVATILGLGQLFNYDDLADPVNKLLMENIILVSEELDVIVKEVVRKSNKAGL